jgi:hypothetical protein
MSTTGDGVWFEIPVAVGEDGLGGPTNWATAQFRAQQRRAVQSSELESPAVTVTSDETLSSLRTNLAALRNAEHNTAVRALLLQLGNLQTEDTRGVWIGGRMARPPVLEWLGYSLARRQATWLHPSYVPLGVSFGEVLPGQYVSCLSVHLEPHDAVWANAECQAPRYFVLEHTNQTYVPWAQEPACSGCFCVNNTEASTGASRRVVQCMSLSVIPTLPPDVQFL